MLQVLPFDRQTAESVRLLFLLVGLAFVMQVAFDIVLVRNTYPPVVDDGRDLLGFVTAGKIAADPNSSPRDIYDAELQRRVQEQLTGRTIPPGTGLPFLHPPYLLPVQRTLAPLDYRETWLRWSAIMLCLFLAGFLVLGRSLRYSGVPLAERWAFVSVGLVFGPVVISLVQGQDTALLYLGVAGWLAAFTARRDFLAGIVLSLATIRPQIALVLALPFLFARRRVFVGFFVGSTLLLAWTVAQIGITGVTDFGRILVGAAGAADYGVDPRIMVSLIGILARTVPESYDDLARLVGWVVWLSMIAGLCALWTRRQRDGEIVPTDLGMAVVLSLALAPHLNYHDLSVIHVALAPALVSGSGTGRSGAGWRVIAALLGISLLISLATLSGFPIHDLLIVAGYAVALAVLVRSGPGRAMNRDTSASRPSLR